MRLQSHHPLAVAVVAAIRNGDVESLKRLLGDNPDLARMRIVDDTCVTSDTSRTLLHIATDWPGHFPDAAATITALIAAGAVVNAPLTARYSETALHWAASSDDVAALDALLDAGADIEAPGSVIGGGGPLANAVAFGQWRAARRLVERGARTTLWEAAALGLIEHVQHHLVGDPARALAPWSPRPARAGAQPPDEITHAFWCACHGGQPGTAELLLDRGADLNWIGYDELTPIDAARRSGAKELADWLRGQGAKTAKEMC